MIDVLYFAWIREKVGEPKERLETKATTVGDLMAELVALDERYALAFEDTTAIRVAVDQQLVEMDASIENAREVAFFPPMTGG